LDFSPPYPGAIMQGLMMNRPLLISSLIEHGATAYHDREIVSRTVEGPIHRYTYADLRRRSKQLAGALTTLGVKAGDRIATLAWNGYRHVELYFGVSGMEAICHTLNPRLHPSQLSYIVNHAEDRFLFVDLTFVPLVEAIAEHLKTLEGVVVMTDADHMPESGLANLMCYEDLLSAQEDDFVWPEFDENTASSLCYTSGTTGHPKGVLYSHRSSVLHGYCVSLSGVLALSESEVFLPVVPMFHVNAWGTPYATPMTGTKLVMPGPALDGASLTELMREEGVTSTAGVPTVWAGLLDYWRENDTSVPSLKLLIIGGAAVPRSMVEAFDKEFGVEVRQGWGMTETSPIGTVNVLKPEQRAAPAPERYDIQIRQGRAVYGVEMKIVDAEGDTLPCDGKAFGELKVRGPWVSRGYFRDEKSEVVDSEGWFATGDVATIDSDGYMHITDRMKDLIKSGGEWISSIELEHLAMSHPDVMQAAVIGIPDEKWSERPLLIVKPNPGADPSKEELLGFFKGKVADWWIPDDVVMVEELPIGGTGKVQKLELRKTYG
ncbi:MAG: 3-(methylthio)propionyl-CoA ligase, partial [Gemmatimonadales bacterium]